MVPTFMRYDSLSDPKESLYSSSVEELTTNWILRDNWQTVSTALLTETFPLLTEDDSIQLLPL